ncbi:MAG: hypothetical protein ABIJ16_05130, partial [Bacteroidota bacterium]
MKKSVECLERSIMINPENMDAQILLNKVLGLAINKVNSISTPKEKTAVQAEDSEKFTVTRKNNKKQYNSAKNIDTYEQELIS